MTVYCTPRSPPCFHCIVAVLRNSAEVVKAGASGFASGCPTDAITDARGAMAGVGAGAGAGADVGAGAAADEATCCPSSTRKPPLVRAASLASEVLAAVPPGTRRDVLDGSRSTVDTSAGTPGSLVGGRESPELTPPTGDGALAGFGADTTPATPADEEEVTASPPMLVVDSVPGARPGLGLESVCTPSTVGSAPTAGVDEATAIGDEVSPFGGGELEQPGDLAGEQGAGVAGRAASELRSLATSAVAGGDVVDTAGVVVGDDAEVSRRYVLIFLLSLLLC